MRPFPLRRFLSLVLSAMSAHALACDQTGTVRMDLGQWGSGSSSPGKTFFVLEGGAKTAVPASNTYMNRSVIDNAWPAARMQLAILLAAVSSGDTAPRPSSGVRAANDDQPAASAVLNNQ